MWMVGEVVEGRRRRLVVDVVVIEAVDAVVEGSRSGRSGRLSGRR